VTTAASSALAGVAAQVQLLDVASQASVRAFARRWTDARRPLHVLVNNAGVFCFGGDSRMQQTV
jgi:NAD(P)-dependent dehydrogenase (short-subunit alcohol dehydrogenase family)